MSENKIKEVILCKYGEVVLKGANRSDFEAKMLKDLRRRAKHVGNFNIFYSQSTVFTSLQYLKTISAKPDIPMTAVFAM